MPEDIAIISSKSDVDPCSHVRETDHQKSADGRTDDFSALYSRYTCIYIKGYTYTKFAFIFFISGCVQDGNAPRRDKINFMGALVAILKGPLQDFMNFTIIVHVYCMNQIFVTKKPILRLHGL